MAAALAELAPADAHTVHVELPVRLVRQRDVGEVARVAGRVRPTEVELSADRAGAAWGTIEPEGEDGIVDLFLSDHVVPDRDGTLDRDALEGETHDAVEVGRDEGDPGLLLDLAEGLVRHGEVADAHRVLAHEAGASAGAVLDREVGAIGLVAGRLGGVVLVVDLDKRATAAAGQPRRRETLRYRTRQAMSV